MFLSIQENDNRPMYLQIVNQIKEQVGNGTLRPGEELPSVREVADSLGINMHTVRSAYLKLRDQGIINMRLGRRAKVSRRQAPAQNTELKTGINIRVKELITDALLSGIQTDDLRKLINEQLDRMK